MRLIFCSDPLWPAQPDEAYAAEVAAAGRVGLSYSLVSYEALVYDHDPARAVRRVDRAENDTEVGVYRGWMVTPKRYADLYAALADRGVRLINSPAQYEHCHYLPRWYARLAGHTPRSAWIAREDISAPALKALLMPFGEKPVIVKDYVKSRKHEWREACYIPSAADADAVERVTGRFFELVGGDLNVGLAFREFVDFEPVGSHAISGMPLTREYRLFFLDGEPIQVSRYWDEGDYAGDEPPMDHFAELAPLIESRFFTMDVAQTKTGEWLVVELGDAQVAALPPDADPEQFFAKLSLVQAAQD